MFRQRREVSFAKWVKVGQDFDLTKFTGSFSRIADFSAWYPGSKASEQEPEERGTVGVPVCFPLLCTTAC